MYDWSYTTIEEAKRKAEDFAKEHGLLTKGTAILLEALTKFPPNEVFSPYVNDPTTNDLIQYLENQRDAYQNVIDKLKFQKVMDNLKE